MRITNLIRNNTMNYAFVCKVINEDTDEVIALGSTYIEPTSISTFGECESVDMEVGKLMRSFKKVWLKEQEPTEPDDYTGAGDPLDNDR